MRLRGLSVSAQTSMEHTFTPLPSGARDMLKGNALELLIDLCESLPKSDSHGRKLHTKYYRTLKALILDRTGRIWDPSNLHTTLKKLINIGVVRKTAEGDLEIVYEAFIQRGLYTDRKKSEQASKAKQGPNNKEPQSAKPLELPESDLTVIDVKPQKVRAAIPVMDEATIRSQTFNKRQVAKQTYADEKGLRDWEARQRQEDCEEEEEESPIDKLIRERQEKQEEEAAKERSITAGMSFVERTEYKRKQRLGEPQATIQPSERELEFARRRKAQAAEDAEMQRFAEWLDYQGDPRIIWDERDRHGYQDYLESLKPKPKPEPVPVSASSDVDDGSNW